MKSKLLVRERVTARRLVPGCNVRQRHAEQCVEAPQYVQIQRAERDPRVLIEFGEDARASFCTLYLDVLGRLDALFGVPMPYIAAWYQAPGGDAFACQEFALHLRVFSIRRAPEKLKYLAGSESGMGVWINDILPEDAARRLQEAE